MSVAYSKAGRDDLAVLFAEGAIGTLSDAELLARFAAAGQVAETRYWPGLTLKVQVAASLPVPAVL